MEKKGIVKNNNLYNETQLAEYLGISKKKLQKDRCRNEGIPYIKIGSLVRYKIDAVNDWLDQQTVKTISYQ